MIDALFLERIAVELNQTLCGGKIDKINMPEPDEIILTIRANRTNYRLLINTTPSDSRIHLTQEVKENPIVAPAFLMHLRKHIGGGVINSITSIPFERAVIINITAQDDLLNKQNWQLVCEIMGKFSNIILVDSNDKITDCLKHVSMDLSTKRQLFPSLTYLPPPEQEQKVCPTSPCLPNILQEFTSGRVDGFIQKQVFGLAPMSIREAVFRAIGTNTSAGLSNQQIGLIVSELAMLYKRPNQPTVTLNNGVPQDFLPFPYLHLNAEYATYPTLSEATDNCTRERAMAHRFMHKSRALQTLLKSKINRLEKRLSALVESERQASDLENDKNIADLILSNLHLIKKGDSKLKCFNFFDNCDVCIDIDSKLTPQQNAQLYYKRYNKKKRAIAYASQETAIVQEQLDYLYTVRETFRLCNTDAELAEIQQELSPTTQKKTKQKPITSKPDHYVVAGFNIYAGKNNAQNERLTLGADSSDTFFHVQNASGCHVVVENRGKPLPDKVILFAAKLAVKNSKLHNSPKAEVAYCPIKNVKKNRSAPLGMVYYSNYKTIMVSLDQ